MRRTRYAAPLAIAALFSACDLIAPPEPDRVEILISDSSYIVSNFLVLYTNETFQLEARVFDRDGAELVGHDVQWSSTLPERIAVDDNGLLMAAPDYGDVCGGIRAGYCVSGIFAKAASAEDVQMALLVPPPFVFFFTPRDTAVTVGDTVVIRSSLTWEGDPSYGCSSWRATSTDETVVGIISEEPGEPGEEVITTVALGPGEATVYAYVSPSTYCSLDPSDASTHVTVREP